MKKAVIFDLDGTILDTIQGISKALNIALENAGYDFRYDAEGTKALIGDGVDMLIKRALKDKDNEENFKSLKANYLPIYDRCEIEAAVPFPGLVDVLNQLKKQGLELYVCTNKPHDLAVHIVNEKYGEGYFKDVLGIREGDTPKPDPTNLLNLLKKHGLELDDVIMVGDSGPDIHLANNAKVESILCTWGYGFFTDKLRSESTYVIDETSQLLDIIK